RRHTRFSRDWSADVCSSDLLTDGLEWNVKVTTKEIPHIIDKFKKTFESYWASNEFEPYQAGQYEQLSQALSQSKFGKKTTEFTQIGRASSREEVLLAKVRHV